MYNRQEDLNTQRDAGQSSEDTHPERCVRWLGGIGSGASFIYPKTDSATTQLFPHEILGGYLMICSPFLGGLGSNGRCSANNYYWRNNIIVPFHPTLTIIESKRPKTCYTLNTLLSK